MLYILCHNIRHSPSCLKIETTGNGIHIDSLTWQYKPTGGDYSQLMRVYSKGEFLSQPYSVVANVWDCDSLTTVEWYEDGQYRAQGG